MKTSKYSSLDSKLEDGSYESLTLMELLQTDFKEFRRLLLLGEIKLTIVMDDTLRSINNNLIPAEDIKEMLDDYYEQVGQEMEERDYRQQNDASDNPYYDDRLDMDQQSPDFWNEIG